MKVFAAALAVAFASALLAQTPPPTPAPGQPAPQGQPPQGPAAPNKETERVVAAIRLAMQNQANGEKRAATIADVPEAGTALDEIDQAVRNARAASAREEALAALDEIERAVMRARAALQKAAKSEEARPGEKPPVDPAAGATKGK